MQEATLRAMQASEERRLAMLRSCEIDPMTGLKMQQSPAPVATPTAPPVIRIESAEEYERRFEQRRREQLEALEKRMRERGGRG